MKLACLLLCSAAGGAGGGAAVGIGRRLPHHARMTAAAARSMSSRRASINRSKSTAGSMKPCGRRRPCSRAFLDMRPVDGAPADNGTDVLVWYSPTAMHFGIRAIAPAGSVRATLADRDRIQSDDHVIIFLSTYNDGRQALVFGVNPLGVQLDGALAEGTRGRAAASPGSRPDGNRPTSAPTTCSSRRDASPTAATKSKSAFPSRACATSRSRRRTGASTSRASCRTGHRRQLGAGEAR